MWLCVSSHFNKDGPITEVKVSVSQRVMEQRVSTVLEKLLPKPSLTNPIPMDEGGYQQVGDVQRKFLLWSLTLSLKWRILTLTLFVCVSCMSETLWYFGLGRCIILILWSFHTPPVCKLCVHRAHYLNWMCTPVCSCSVKVLFKCFVWIFSKYSLTIFRTPHNWIVMLVQYLRMLAGAYEKTKDLAKELQALGCGDLDVEGMALLASNSQSKQFWVEIICCRYWLFYSSIRWGSIIFSFLDLLGLSRFCRDVATVFRRYLSRFQCAF